MLYVEYESTRDNDRKVQLRKPRINHSNCFNVLTKCNYCNSPHKIPSFLDSSRAIKNDSSSVITSISSTKEGSSTIGVTAPPIPSTCKIYKFSNREVKIISKICVLELHTHNYVSVWLLRTIIQGMHCIPPCFLESHFIY